MPRKLDADDLLTLLGLARPLAALIAEIREALRDGKIDGAEGKRIGDKLIDIVRAVA